MENNEVMTEEQLDALIDGFENGEQEEAGVDLESFIAEEEGHPDEEQAEPQQEEDEGEADDEQDQEGESGTDKPRKEPGYVKNRIEKAVTRATEELNAAWQAKFDAVIGPLQARLDEEDAQELVRSRKVGDIETARELVRLRKGQPAQQPSVPQEQPRQANGQFAPKDDPVISARIAILTHQADVIKDDEGIDVMAEFDKNADIRKKVLSGEMDFHDVAKVIKNRPQRRKPPAPMRSPNGVNGPERDIMSLSDAQFDKLVEKVRKG